MIENPPKVDIQLSRATTVLKLQFVVWQILYCVLENHVFLGTRIDQKIVARHVFIDDAQLRASSSCATTNNFFIGAHGQELSVPRNSTLIMIPRNTEIGSQS